MANGCEEVEFLVRSPNRVGILRAVERNRPAAAGEIEDELDVSHRTIVRQLRKLAGREYVERTPDAWDLTLYGSLALEQYRALEGEFEVLMKYRPVLGNLEDESFDIDPELLRGCTLTVATEAEPYAPLSRVTELRLEATRIRLLSPKIEARSINQSLERIDDGEDFELEVVLSEDALETLSSARDSSRLDRLVEAEQMTVMVANGDVPAFLGRMDDHAAIGVSVDGSPHAVVDDTSPELREWVDEQFARFRADAIPVTDHAAYSESSPDTGRTES